MCPHYLHPPYLPAPRICSSVPLGNSLCSWGLWVSSHHIASALLCSSYPSFWALTLGRLSLTGGHFLYQLHALLWCLAQTFYTSRWLECDLSDFVCYCPGMSMYTCVCLYARILYPLLPYHFRCRIPPVVVHFHFCLPFHSFPWSSQMWCCRFLLSHWSLPWWYTRCVLVSYPSLLAAVRKTYPSPPLLHRS